MIYFARIAWRVSRTGYLVQSKQPIYSRLRLKIFDVAYLRFCILYAFRSHTIDPQERDCKQSRHDLTGTDDSGKLLKEKR